MYYYRKDTRVIKQRYMSINTLQLIKKRELELSRGICVCRLDKNKKVPKVKLPLPDGKKYDRGIEEGRLGICFLINHRLDCRQKDWPSRSIGWLQLLET